MFYCKSVNGKCTKQVIGCVEGGKQLFDGQKYRRDGTVFQCEVWRKKNPKCSNDTRIAGPKK